MDKISIVIPCFNEEEAIPVYYEEMKKIMKEMAYVNFELFLWMMVLPTEHYRN